MGSAPYNVAGVYHDADTARGAMDALQRAGIEAGDIALSGETIARAAARTDTARRDRATLWYVAMRVVAGMFLGTAGGALLGFAISFAVYGSPLGEPGNPAWAFILAGAIAGGAVGGVVSGVRTLDLGEEWELTFAATPGDVVVAVHADEPDVVERAADVLRSNGAEHVRRYGPTSRRRAG